MTVITVIETENEVRSEISRLSNDVEQQKIQLDRQTELTAELKTLLGEYLSARYEVFDKLTKVYYDKTGCYQVNKDVYVALKKMIEDVRDDKTILKKMEEVANRAKDNIMKDFREEFPALNDWEYSLYLFFVSGFSAKSVSLFQDVPIERIYNRKKSLLDKIRAKKGENNRYGNALEK